MIAGVVPDDIWPSSGLTAKTWLNQPTDSFPIETLWASQPTVFWGYLVGTPPAHLDVPHVVVWNGQRVIESGHHAVMRALLRGWTHIEARWVEVA